MEETKRSDTPTTSSSAAAAAAAPAPVVNTTTTSDAPTTRKVQRKRVHVTYNGVTVVSKDNIKRARTNTNDEENDSKDSGSNEEDNSAPTLAVLYSPGGRMPDLSDYIGKLVEVRIAAKYLSIRNKEVTRHRLWGTDVYTDDSDIVAILQHTGRMMLRSSASSSLIGSSVVIRVLPPRTAERDNYVGTLRYHYRSRDWSPAYTHTSIQIVSEQKIQGTLNNPKGQKEPEPDLIKMHPAVERQAGKSTPFSLLRKNDLPDVAVVYNAANEPCLKYSLSLVRDLAMRPDDWTSARLKREVFYFETSSIATPVTYELVRDKDATSRFDQYRWAEVVRDPKNLRPVVFTSVAASSPSSSPTSLTSGKRAKRKGRAGEAATSASPTSEETKATVVRAPLEASQVRVVERGLDWDDFEWSPSSVVIRGVTYPLHAFWAIPISS